MPKVKSEQATWLLISLCTRMSVRYLNSILQGHEYTIFHEHIGTSTRCSPAGSTLPKRLPS